MNRIIVADKYKPTADCIVRILKEELRKDSLEFEIILNERDLLNRVLNEKYLMALIDNELFDKEGKNAIEILRKNETPVFVLYERRYQQNLIFGVKSFEKNYANLLKIKDEILGHLEKQ